MPDTPLHKLVEPFVDEPWFKAIGDQRANIFAIQDEAFLRDIIFAHAVRALPCGEYLVKVGLPDDLLWDVCNRNLAASIALATDPDPLAAALAAHRALKERAALENRG